MVNPIENEVVLIEANFDFEGLTGNSSSEDYADCVLKYSCIASGLTLHNSMQTPQSTRRIANKLLAKGLRVSMNLQFEQLMLRLETMLPEQRGKALAFMTSTIRSFEAHYE